MAEPSLIETHNGTPVTPDNLRWAATHEALCRSWIFDVLTGLADQMDPAATSPAVVPDDDAAGGVS
jgi:hypothetical protein